MRTSIRAALLVGVPLALPFAALDAAAQQPDATLVVAVRSAATGEPLADAQVVIEDAEIGGLTDRRGVLRLHGVPAGEHTIAIQFTGYSNAATQILLEPGETRGLAFVLELVVVPLSELEVRARLGLRRLAQRGFYERKSLGLGAFITRAEIEQRRPRLLSDMVRTVAGVRVNQALLGNPDVSMRRSELTRRCPIQYYVDGMPVMGFNLDDVPPRDVEGLEIYRGASEIPPEFNRRGSLCGVIVIWTRID